MQKLILFLTLLVMTSAAAAADSPKDVQALIARGDYAGAEAMLRQATAEHPQSAKAHYVLAEVLAHEGNIGEAKTEASKAATLDPATHFTDPAKFQHFQRELNAALAPPTNTRALATPARRADGQVPIGGERAESSSHFTGILIIGAVLALIAFLWMRRKRDDNRFNGYPSTPPMDVPPYAGYSGSGPYAPPPPPHSGVGTAVAAGLGGVAAGMLLDEALRSHREGDVTRNDVGTGNRYESDPSAQAYNDLRSDPIDMGNNDSSWDDSSSGDSGSFDDNSW